MAIYSRNMTQPATYFPPAGQNGFGDLAYGAAQSVMVRWQDKAELFRDTEAREVMSSAVVYVDQDCEIGGKIGLGSATVTEAREIRQLGRTPSLKGDDELVKLWL